MGILSPSLNSHVFRKAPAQNSPRLGARNSSNIAILSPSSEALPRDEEEGGVPGTEEGVPNKAGDVVGQAPPTREHQEQTKAVLHNVDPERGTLEEVIVDLKDSGNRLEYPFISSSQETFEPESPESYSNTPPECQSSPDSSGKSPMFSMEERLGNVSCARHSLDVVDIDTCPSLSRSLADVGVRGRKEVTLDLIDIFQTLPIHISQNTSDLDDAPTTPRHGSDPTGSRSMTSLFLCGSEGSTTSSTFYTSMLSLLNGGTKAMASADRRVLSLTRYPAVLQSHSSRVSQGSAEQRDVSSTPSLPHLGTSSRSLETFLHETITELVTFDRCEELLRGVSMATVLDNFGALFSNSSSSSDTFALSAQVTSINYFLSHNWCVSRMQKMLALTLHFYMDVALLLTFLLCVLIAALASLDVLPVVRYNFEQSTGQCPFAARAVAVPFFVVVMFSMQKIASWFKLDGPTVFLDKVCINQASVELQQQGIKKLGAFLRKSEKLIILYTDTYFTRLWTTYEVAGFLTTHSVKDVEVVHTFEAMLFFTELLAFYFFAISVPIITAFSDSWMGIYIVFTAAGSPLIWFLRRSFRERQEIRRRLVSFDIRNCSCTQEQDRELIYNNITALMKACQAVRMNASRQDALDAFNTKIRHDFPMAFKHLMTGNVLGYKHCAVLGFITSGLLIFDKCRTWLEHPLSEQGVDVGTSLLWALVLWPLALCLMDWMSHLCSNVRGWLEIVVAGLQYFACAACTAATDVVVRFVNAKLLEHDLLGRGLVPAYLIFVVVAVIFTQRVFACRLPTCCAATPNNNNNNNNNNNQHEGSMAEAESI